MVTLIETLLSKDVYQIGLKQHIQDLAHLLDAVGAEFFAFLKLLVNGILSAEQLGG